MSKSSKTVHVDQCCRCLRGCDGHDVTVTHDKTSDLVEVKVTGEGGKRYLFDDEIFAAIIRAWTGEE